MGVLTRYLIRVHMGPFLFALSGITALIFLNSLSQRVGDLVGKGLPWTVIVEFLVLSLPHVIALALPMAVLVAVLYAFNDHVADYTWLRPYLGAGLNFYRSSTTTSLVGVDTSDSGFGAQMFGGGELSFASVPQFAISTEFSYRWFDAPFEGLDLGGVGFSVAAHWYLK